MTIVDLTRPLEAGMPHARNIPDPTFAPARTWEEHHMRAIQLNIPTHLGTHLDAPSHFLEHGSTLDDVPLDTLIGRAYCLEVLRPGPDPVTDGDLLAGLAANGVTLAPGDALLIRTGWDERYDTDEYIGAHAYLTPEAAQWCAGQRLRLVGMDTITPEYPMDLRQPGYHHHVHGNLLGAGTLIIENLDLHEVADRWVTLFVGAIRVAGGDGAPARVLAVCD